MKCQVNQSGGNKQNPQTLEQKGHLLMKKWKTIVTFAQDSAVCLGRRTGSPPTPEWEWPLGQATLSLSFYFLPVKSEPNLQAQQL